MRKLALALIAIAIPYQSVADDNEIVGTYKLVSEQRRIVDTDEIVPGSVLPGLHLVRQERPHAGRPHPLATTTSRKSGKND